MRKQSLERDQYDERWEDGEILGRQDVPRVRGGESTVRTVITWSWSTGSCRGDSIRSFRGA